jgi:hypothetical protein
MLASVGTCIPTFGMAFCVVGHSAAVAYLGPWLLLAIGGGILLAEPTTGGIGNRPIENVYDLGLMQSVSPADSISIEKVKTQCISQSVLYTPLEFLCDDLD